MNDIPEKFKIKARDLVELESISCGQTDDNVHISAHARSLMKAEERAKCAISRIENRSPIDAKVHMMDLIIPGFDPTVIKARKFVADENFPPDHTGHKLIMLGQSYQTEVNFTLRILKEGIKMGKGLGD